MSKPEALPDLKDLRLKLARALTMCDELDALCTALRRENALLHGLVAMQAPTPAYTPVLCPSCQKITHPDLVSRVTGLCLTCRSR